MVIQVRFCFRPGVSLKVAAIGIRVARGREQCEDRRFTLRNNRLSIHHIGGRSEHRTLSGADELMTVLHETFRLSAVRISTTKWTVSAVWDSLRPTRAISAPGGMARALRATRSSS